MIGSLGRKHLPPAPSLQNCPEFKGTDFIQSWGREMERTGHEDNLDFSFKLWASEILDALVLGSFMP